MKNLLMLLSILTLVSCGQTSDSNGSKKPLTENKLEDNLIASVTDKPEEIKVLSFEFLSQVGIYFVQQNGEFGIESNADEGITNQDKIKALEAFKKDIISLHDTQNLKWFFYSLIFNRTIDYPFLAGSYSENDVEGIIEKSLNDLKHKSGNGTTISESNRRYISTIFTKFEPQTNFTTGLCITKVGSERNVSHAIAVHSTDNRANTYVESFYPEICTEMIDHNSTTFPAHTKIRSSSIYTHFNCYKVNDQKSNYFLVKELTLRNEEDIEELILINQFDSVEKCEDAKKLQHI